MSAKEAPVTLDSIKTHDLGEYVKDPIARGVIYEHIGEHKSEPAFFMQLHLFSDVSTLFWISDLTSPRIPDLIGAVSAEVVNGVDQSAAPNLRFGILSHDYTKGKKDPIEKNEEELNHDDMRNEDFPTRVAEFTKKGLDEALSIVSVDLASEKGALDARPISAEFDLWSYSRNSEKTNILDGVGYHEIGVQIKVGSYIPVEGLSALLVETSPILRRADRGVVKQLLSDMIEQNNLEVKPQQLEM